MKEIKGVLLGLLLIVCFFTQTILANENINIEDRNRLENHLSDLVDEYNKIVADENSSFEEVIVQTKKIMQIESELEEIGMVANFEPTSGVHQNNKNEMMPTTISFEIVPDITQKKEEYNFDMTEDKKEVLEEIYGTDITMGEYIEKIFPEALDVLSKKTLKEYYETPMNWKNNPSKFNESVSSSVEGDNSFIIKRPPSSENLIYSNLDLSFFSSDKTKLRPTFVLIQPSSKFKIIDMNVFSYLWKHVDTAVL
jgi:hypothetical protein